MYYSYFLKKIPPDNIRSISQGLTKMHIFIIYVFEDFRNFDKYYYYF